MFWMLTVVFLFGHIAFWITLFNRVHAMSLSCRVVRMTELVFVLVAVGGLLGTLNKAVAQPDWLATLVTAARPRWDVSTVLFIYIMACCLWAIWVSIHWAWRKGWKMPDASLVSNHTQRIDVARQLGKYPMQGWSTRLFAVLPTNQMFDLYIQTKTILLPNLPEELDGLSILHLSDLHFTGKITRPFFDQVFEQAQQLDADLVAVTGDILESVPCFAWLPETLGRLRSRHGVYFVLGNHDKRVEGGVRLRAELAALGLVDVGRSAREVAIHGRRVVLSGNELPWFGPPPELPEEPNERESLRILLAHTPDQLPWARQQGVDLMLAGHTHGGHIRLPLFGPLVCPSRFGVKYACGLFYEPPTTMHVSRGISGLDPLRFNCPPEVSKLVLRSSSVAR